MKNKDLISREGMSKLIDDVWSDYYVDTVDKFRDELQERLIVMPSTHLDTTQNTEHQIKTINTVGK